MQKQEGRANAGALCSGVPKTSERRGAGEAERLVWEDSDRFDRLWMGLSRGEENAPTSRASLDGGVASSEELRPATERFVREPLRPSGAGERAGDRERPGDSERWMFSSDAARRSENDCRSALSRRAAAGAVRFSAVLDVERCD